MLVVGGGVHGNAGIEVSELIQHGPDRTAKSVTDRHGGFEPEGVPQEGELEQQVVLGDDLLRSHVADPGQRQDLCGRPAASSADENCNVCAATTLSSARPWIRRSGR